MTNLAQLDSHPVYENIEQAIETLSLIENDAEYLANIGDHIFQVINRLHATYNLLKTRLDSADPYTLRKSVLDTINQQLNYINNITDSYKTRLSSNISNINNYVENILANITAIPVIVDRDSVEGIKDTVISFRRAVGQHKRILETEQEELKEKTEGLLDNYNELNSAFNDSTQTFRETSEKLNNKLKEFEEQFEIGENEREDSFKEQKENIEALFNEKIAEYDEQWNQLLEEKNEKIQQTIINLESIQQKFLEDSKKKQDEYDETLNKHKSSVEELVGIISTNSISGHYKIVADKKEKLTYLWQGITILGFLLTIGFGFYAFVLSKGLDWPSLVARFIVTGALGTFTTYSARQVNKNELEERRNRKMEVELKTLNPYIASFSESDQKKLKEQLFPQIFGKAEIDENSQSLMKNNINDQDFVNLTTIIEKLKSFEKDHYNQNK